MEADSSPLRVLVYVDVSGRIPFAFWRDKLDGVARARVQHRIERLRSGNWGDWRVVGDGVVELRIHHGQGHRIYVGRQDLEAVVLLGGGDKSTQGRDIRAAQARWADFRKRSSEARG